MAFLTSWDKQEVKAPSSNIEDISSAERAFSDDLAVALSILEKGDKLQVSVGEKGIIKYKIIDKKIAQDQISFR